ncbi:MAG: SDR family NAD(P)-dependent oxidoreductase [bacterium]|nr:SDR family NAD(P)-dependent oxidoreductase [bacterium]
MKQRKWDGNNISDQSGRIAIVTGASSGIGYETARVLAHKNAEVIIAVRNLEKGNAAAAKIKEGYKKADVKVMKLDLARLESVRQFAENFKNGYSRLDLLINNAGVMIPPYSKTADGFELQFGTNHLGHFLLTMLLLDLLTGMEESRIVNVSSTAHKFGNINFDDLNWEKRKYKPSRAYGDSKIANLYFTYQLDKRLKEKNHDTVVASSHPGWTATDLQRHSGSINFLNRFFAQGIDMGALPTLYAAVAPGVRGGDFFGPSGFMEMKGYPKKVDSNKRSLDQDVAEKLWAVSEKLTDIG